jgi:hypothetical protein
VAVIEGASKRPFSKAGAPANNDFNGQAAKGDLVIDSTNGVLYINTGTLAATVWTKVGVQV